MKNRSNGFVLSKDDLKEIQKIKRQNSRHEAYFGKEQKKKAGNRTFIKIIDKNKHKYKVVIGHGMTQPEAMREIYGKSANIIKKGVLIKKNGTQIPVAVKVIKFKNEDEARRAVREMDISKDVDLCYGYLRRDYPQVKYGCIGKIIGVMHVLPGPDLVSQIQQRENNSDCLTNSFELIDISVKLLDEASRIAKIGLIHGDYKVDNMSYNEKTGEAQIFDYGEAFYITDYEGGKKTNIPTEVCAPPEIILHSYLNHGLAAVDECIAKNPALLSPEEKIKFDEFMSNWNLEYRTNLEVQDSLRKIIQNRSALKKVMSIYKGANKEFTLNEKSDVYSFALSLCVLFGISKTSLADFNSKLKYLLDHKIDASKRKHYLRFYENIKTRPILLDDKKNLSKSYLKDLPIDDQYDIYQYLELMLSPDPSVRPSFAEAHNFFYKMCQKLKRYAITNNDVNESYTTTTTTRTISDTSTYSLFNQGNNVAINDTDENKKMSTTSPSRSEKLSTTSNESDFSDHDELRPLGKSVSHTVGNHHQYFLSPNASSSAPDLPPLPSSKLPSTKSAPSTPTIKKQQAQIGTARQKFQQDKIFSQSNTSTSLQSSIPEENVNDNDEKPKIKKGNE